MNWDWFLAARDPEDGVTKTFYLARIREARNTNFHFTPPKDFDAAKYFGDSIGLYVGGKPFRFKVRIAKEIAPWITEVRWHPAQKLEALKNGDVVLDLPAGSLIEAKRFVLSLGRFGKALGPKELVDSMSKSRASRRSCRQSGRIHCACRRRQCPRPLSPQSTDPACPSPGSP